MTFIPAAHFTKGRKKAVNLIVLHTMEAAEGPDTAEAVASWFAGANAPQASAHFCVDSDSIVRCVADEDTAWHTKGGDINARAIGIEMAGYAKQSDDEWHDAYSEAMLDQTASLVAALCLRYQIPLHFLSSEQILTGAAGITTHRNCTTAFKVPGGHSDPGPNFPMNDFLAKVEAYVAYPAE
jgi:N-acetyl-anhydromuramyl-L-alanine amidase AmpD